MRRSCGRVQTLITAQTASVSDDGYVLLTIWISRKADHQGFVINPAMGASSGFLRLYPSYIWYDAHAVSNISQLMIQKYITGE